MDAKLKVTDVQEEASFYDLVAGDNMLEIPLFQRPYKWKESHYKAVLQDISGIDEETSRPLKKSGGKALEFGFAA